MSFLATSGDKCTMDSERAIDSGGYVRSGAELKGMMEISRSSRFWEVMAVFFPFFS